MKESRKVILQRWEECYGNVMALYVALSSSREQYTIRRAAIGKDGVPADPIDFIADVEIKAKRTLSPVMYEMFLRLAEEGQADLLPKADKQALGLKFLKSNMHEAGDYRTLYFRVKNNQREEAVEA